MDGDENPEKIPEGQEQEEQGEGTESTISDETVSQDDGRRRFKEGQPIGQLEVATVDPYTSLVGPFLSPMEILAQTACVALHLTPTAYKGLSEATRQQLLLCMPPYSAIQQTRALLSGLSLFQRLSTEDAWVLATQMVTKVYPPDYQLVFEGEAVWQALIVSEGALVVTEEKAKSDEEDEDTGMLRAPLQLWTRELIHSGMWGTSIKVADSGPATLLELPLEKLSLLSPDGVDLLIAHHMPLLGYDGVFVAARVAEGQVRTRKPLPRMQAMRHLPVIELGQKTMDMGREGIGEEPDLLNPETKDS